MLTENSVSRIRVVEDEDAQVGKDVIRCLLGKDLTLKKETLEAFCRIAPSPIEIDLLLLAGVVTFSDRKVRRSSVTWARRFEVEMPVHDPSIWLDSSVEFFLSETLRFLTGDYWSFSFRPRKNVDKSVFQLSMTWQREREVRVIPYSGGMDSFLELKLFHSRYPDLEPFLVTMLHTKALMEPLASTLRLSQSASKLLAVPVRHESLHHAEQSYRSRTFLFFVAAAVAAKLTRADMVLIPENGQGALGPSFVTWGSEHPFHASHPGFTWRLRALLESLWGAQSPQFLHSNIWSTKAEVLREVDETVGLRGWEETRSCSANTKRVKGRLAPPQCGICGGCLLRRLALRSAGVPSQGEKYLWSDLDAPSLEESVDVDLRDSVRPTTRNDWEIATSSCIDHKSLASLTGPTGKAFKYRGSLGEIARGLGVDVSEAATKLDRLLVAHSTQWRNFIGDLKEDSWMRRLAEGS
jgi:7-cyano-7-deazaguanine synthase in queuosine biosynthesis